MPESAAIGIDALLQLVRVEPLALGLLGALALGALLLLFVAAGFAPWRRRAYPVKVAFASFATSLTAVALLGLLLFVVDLRAVTQRAMAEVLVEDARLARQLDSWLAAQREQVSALARDLPHGASVIDPEAAYRRLEQHLLANSGVRSMLVADASGAIVAGVRRATNARGVQRLAASGSIADRAYFTEPMRTGSAYLADAFALEVTDADPVLAVSAPVGPRGEFAGIVQATLVPAALGSLLAAEARAAPTDLMVLDAAERVLQASEGFEVTEMRPVADAGIRATLEQDAPLRLDPAGRTLLFSQAELANGWLVASRTDLGDATAGARRRGLMLVVGLALLVLLATLAAPRAVRRISDPLRLLGQGMAGYDPARSRATLRAPRSAPRELRSLFAEYALMQRRLTRADRTVRDTLVDETRQRRTVETSLAQRNNELTGVQNQLRALVRTDALTGVANHRALREHLKFACGASRRIGQPLSVVLVDIDRFKDYNDEYGHPAGDACLCAVADALCEVARRSLDMVARHGGAQFAMVLAVTDAEHALLVAEKARAAVAALAVEDRRNPKGVVTVTLGVATTAPGRELEPDELLAGAGSALNTAKQAGRDCVSFASDRAPASAPAPVVPHEETVTMEGGLPGGRR
jgi:diguanylate cyclase (GGDEF)-like protein